MKRTRVVSVIGVVVILFIAFALEDSYGIREKRTTHHEYANVVINNVSEKNNIAPVVFNHWLHRAQYSCRVCHVDLKFALKANGSGITEGANNKGQFCGACHNGKDAFGPEDKGISPGKSKKNCDRCHSYGKKVKFDKHFYEYTKDLPRARFGNGVNWMKAEEDNMLSLKDEIKGISEKRAAVEIPADSELLPKEQAMPHILFSHKKHAVWNGCELCHPSPFEEKAGKTRFTMEQIFGGKYCGTCHGKVSFPTLDCQRCHVKPTIVKEVN